MVLSAGIAEIALQTWVVHVKAQSTKVILVVTMVCPRVGESSFQDPVP